MAPSFVDSTIANTISSSSFSVTKPTGTAAGHLLVAMMASDGSYASIGIPSGGTTWALLTGINPAGFGAAVKLFWKIAGSSEPSNYGMTHASGEGVGIVAAVSGADTSAPQAATADEVGSGTTITTPTLTPAGPDDLDLRFAVAQYFGVFSFSPPASYSEREDDGASSLFAALATRALPDGNATGTKNFTGSDTPIARRGLTVLVTSPVGRPQTRVVTARYAPHRAATW